MKSSGRSKGGDDSGDENFHEKKSKRGKISKEKDQDQVEVVIKKEEPLIYDKDEMRLDQYQNNI